MSNHDNRMWHRSSRPLFGTTLVLLTLLSLGPPGCSRSRPSGARAVAVPAAVETVARRKDFVSSVRLHGTVEAVRSFVVSAPRLAGSATNSLVVTKLAVAGAEVKKGDLVVAFDREGQEKAARDRRADYLDLLAQIRKKQAEQDTAREQDETELAKARHDVERARLDILKNQFLSAIDVEKNEQALEEAQATLAQLRETFDLERKAARAELRILEIQRDRALAVARHSEANAGKMSIASPIDGLVVLKTSWKNGRVGEVQEGEEVRSGTPILEVIGRAGMQVRARINQADAHLLRVGMPAAIGLDAYPGVRLTGRLEQLAPVAGVSDFSDRVRFFIGVFSVSGTDAKLMPDLSAAVDVEIARADHALVVPRHALVSADGGWFVSLPGGDRRRVDVGPMNDLEAVVRSGLDEGMRIVSAGGTGREAS